MRRTPERDELQITAAPSSRQAEETLFFWHALRPPSPIKLFRIYVRPGLVRDMDLASMIRKFMKSSACKGAAGRLISSLEANHNTRCALAILTNAETSKSNFAGAHAIFKFRHVKMRLPRAIPFSAQSQGHLSPLTQNPYPSPHCL